MSFTTSNALDFPLLSLVVFLPLVGAGVVAVLPRRHDVLHHATAILTAATACPTLRQRNVRPRPPR